MAILVEIEFPGATALQYEEVRKLAGIGDGKPQGAIAHVAIAGDDGLRIVDLWETEADLKAFLEVILPLTQQVGIQPPAEQRRISPVYNYVV
jgi:hypothetical protein